MPTSYACVTFMSCLQAILPKRQPRAPSTTQLLADVSRAAAMDAKEQLVCVAQAAVQAAQHTAEQLTWVAGLVAGDAREQIVAAADTCVRAFGADNKQCRGIRGRVVSVFRAVSKAVGWH